MVELKPFTPQDFPRLLHWIDSPRLLVQWAGPQFFAYPLDSGQLTRYWQMGQGDAPEARIFKAVDSGGCVVGHIELGAIHLYNGSAAICRVFVAPQHRSQGIGAAMVRRILAISFDELGLRRVELRVYAFNQAAIRCYQKVGLVTEGVLRQAQRVGDEYWDTVIMAMLKEEWEQRQAEGFHGSLHLL